MIINSISKQFYNKKGITLLEILFTVAILVFLLSVTIGSMRLISGGQKLKAEAKKISTAVEEARSKTLSSEGGQRFGVRLGSDTVVIYEYPYTQNNVNNKTIHLERGVSILSYNLSGGGNEVLFNKISGETDNDGSIVVSYSGSTKEIFIQKTGNSYLSE